jgi:hypothetical protein
VLDRVFYIIKITIVVFNFRREKMKIKTMIVTAIAFWAYVALCLYVMGKLAGAI